MAFSKAFQCSNPQNIILTQWGRPINHPSAQQKIFEIAVRVDDDRTQLVGHKCQLFLTRREGHKKFLYQIPNCHMSKSENFADWHWKIRYFGQSTQPTLETLEDQVVNCHNGAQITTFFQCQSSLQSFLTWHWHDRAIHRKLAWRSMYLPEVYWPQKIP